MCADRVLYIARGGDVAKLRSLFALLRIAAGTVEALEDAEFAISVDARTGDITFGLYILTADPDSDPGDLSADQVNMHVLFKEQVRGTLFDVVDGKCKLHQGGG